MVRPLERRAAARTAVVWESVRGTLPDSGAGPGAVEVLDIGGGTGGFAVRLAELGHHVVVVDPSPDALATLARRAQESGVGDRVVARQGDLGDLLDLVPAESADLVLCHGVLGLVDDPAQALSHLVHTLRPGGRASVVVAQQHASVIARAMAGHFAHARSLLEGAGTTEGERRFTADGLQALVEQAGLRVDLVEGVRVFTDLVPGSLLDLEPGATAALLELEQAAARRPEYLALASQLHVLATA